jgi:S-adenosylmethionine:tRNA ribosyltransferase-isomerase
MRRTDFYFDLPKELIAQRPTEERSASRLLALEVDGTYQDLTFRDLPSLLQPGDLLVFNDTRVVPARVRGMKDSGGRIEILLERALDENRALVQAKASKGLSLNASIELPGGEWARMLGREGDLFLLEFSCAVLPYFEAHGEMPLPPYIARAPDGADRERYQTVYARERGAVAAPTAGLHFDAEVLSALDARGVKRAYLTLHVGAGTFQPMRAEDIDAHTMHSERLAVPEATCDAINAARARGSRVIAVGTTVVRSLETAAGQPGCAAGSELRPFAGETRLFIKPGHRFRVVDAMVTNFHLPQSTLLILCAAFAGREPLLAAYAHAVRARYRFFSYGDAMFLCATAAARA